MKKGTVLLGLCAVLLAGCSGKTEKTSVEPTQNDTAQEAPAATEPEKSLYEGLAKSPLTGLYIEEEDAARRPIAVMINNLHKALPQSGIKQADIIYECLAEGDITRMVAVFQAMTGEKIGPVRSARDYYAYFALDNDAVYVHHGGSEGGYDAIANRGLDDLDGMHDTTAFWRDKTRQNTPGMYEHSSYISAEGVYESCELNGYRMTEPEGYTGMFQFYDEDTDLTGGDSATQVEVHYSNYQVGQFRYDADKKVYERWQSGEPQIDDQTGETLTFKNVLVQLVNMRVIDDAGRRDVDLVGTGNGYYITDGKCVPITWAKEKYNTPTVWYTADGGKLTLNPGKTWVCVHDVQSDLVME